MQLRAEPVDHTGAPLAVLRAFEKFARSAALPSLLLQAEALRALSFLAKACIPCLLLKGSALAYWAYPQPHLRECGDVDLLLPSRAHAERLSALLTASGYERAETSGELVAYELLCRRPVSGEWHIELDIHWRLANSPLFADAFTFEELMADSIAIPKLAPNARGLGPVHALLHACIHRALNLSIGIDDKLKWLYDMELLMALLTPADWQRLVELAKAKKLAGVVRSALEAAALTFGRKLPLELIAALLHAELAEPVDAQRLSDWHYMQRKTYQSLPTIWQKLIWLWQRLFPSRDYLQYLYGVGYTSYPALMAVRIKRVLRRLKN